MYTIVDLCFLCLTKYKNLISILSQDSDGVLVEEKLRFFLSELVNIEPEITKYVCFACLKNLNHVYSFKQLCLRNFDKLSSYIRTLKNTDEPYRNLQVRLIDSQSLKENQVISENESNKEAMEVECINIVNVVKRDLCEQEHIQKTVVDEDAFDNVEKNNAQEVNVTKEKREEMIVDSTGIEYILQGEYIKKIVDIEEILRKEKDVVKKELEDTSYNAENMKAQEDNFIKLEGGPIFEDDKLEHETVDVKEEPTDIYDEIYLNSESDDDLELQNETTNNTECTATSDNSTRNTARRTHTCSVCYKSFKRRWYLTVHMRSHSGERPFKCNVCGKAFRQATHLAVHKRSHSGEKRFKCDVCAKSFSEKRYLTRHKFSHTSEKPYPCNLCNKSFMLPTHKCNKPRPSKTSTNQELYKCDACDRAFKLSSRLAIHKLSHTGEKPFKCDVCEKTFREKRFLKDHTRVHSGEKPYMCHECGAAFRQLSHLKVHKRSHTGHKPYKCDVCAKSFSEKRCLIRHKFSHTGEKPYPCNLCNKSFKLPTHMCNKPRPPKTSTNQELYKCDMCDRAFKISSRLAIHKLSHTGERPFKCDVCEKTFREKRFLKDHTRIHSGEKPYMCHECGAAFRQTSHLNVHKRSHTGHKPYKCDLCEKAFSENRYLKQHKQKHADEPQT